jgi:hypothetical protein
MLGTLRHARRIPGVSRRVRAVPAARGAGAELKLTAPWLALLVFLLLCCLPAPCSGLKSIASEVESQYKLRDVVEAAMQTFDKELAASQDRLPTDQYALARALQER